jgi:hypothetical protein
MTGKWKQFERRNENYFGYNGTSILLTGKCSINSIFTFYLVNEYDCYNAKSTIILTLKDEFK